MYYKTLDQQWLNSKLDLFQIDFYDVKTSMSEFGFSSDQILDSVNPAIYCTCELIINQFMGLSLIDDLGDDLKETLQEQLQSSIFTNYFDSHIQFNYVYNQNREIIRQELVKQLKQSEYYGICEDESFLEQLAELESEYYQLFDSYSF
jgi:hypothetical protein